MMRETLHKSVSRIKCFHVKVNSRAVYCILKIERYLRRDGVYVKKGSTEMEVCLACLCALA